MMKGVRALVFFHGLTSYGKELLTPSTEFVQIANTQGAVVRKWGCPQRTGTTVSLRVARKAHSRNARNFGSFSAGRTSILTDGQTVGPRDRAPVARSRADRRAARSRLDPWHRLPNSFLCATTRVGSPRARPSRMRMIMGGKPPFPRYSKCLMQHPKHITI